MVRRRRTRGLTLLEVLIALGIATVGITGALLMVTIAIRGAGSSRQATEAIVLVQQKLEEEVSRAGISAAALPGQIIETLNGLGQPQTSGSTEVFPFTRVTTWSPTTGTTLRVVVSVSWTDALGAHRRDGIRERNPQ